MEIFWAVVTLVVGAVLGVMVQRGTDRWFSAIKDYELWVDYTAEPLFVNDSMALATGLRYSIGDLELTKPYRVKLHVWRMGEKDLRSDAFSGDLEIQLGVPVATSSLHVDAHTSGVQLVFETSDADAAVRIQPSLVRPDFVATYDFVSDGLPQLKTRNPVADLQVTSFFTETEEKNRIAPSLAWIGGLSLALCIVGLIILTILAKAVPELGTENFIAYAFLLGPFGIISLTAASAVSPRRARIARKALRRRTHPYALSGPQIKANATISGLSPG